MTADPTAFLRALGRAQPPPTQWTRLGTIDGGYSGGRPQVVMDGETAASARTYPYVASYAPAAGDRVMLMRSGATWVIVGKVI